MSTGVYRPYPQPQQRRKSFEPLLDDAVSGGGGGGGGGDTSARHRNAFRVIKSLRVKLIGR